MPTKRLSMRNLREILRLRYESGLSLRQIKGSQRVSLGAVQTITSKAESASLDWAQIAQLDEQQLARLFYPESDTQVSNQFQCPDWVEVHRELRRPGVTKHLLWEEYTQSFPNRSYSYPQYCFLFQEWARKQKRSMRQVHKAGDKLFVD